MRSCRRAQEEVGTVDVLVNNAAISTRSAITRLTDEEWDLSIAVNLTAPMHFIRELVPGMKQAGWGRIVNVTSGAGVHGVARVLGLLRGRRAASSGSRSRSRWSWRASGSR